MRKSILVGLVSCLCLLWSVSGFAQDEQTVKGEVLDLSCYIKSGAKGAGHAACAKSCVKKWSTNGPAHR